MQHYDVYASNGQFSHKFPGNPLFIICVCDGDGPPSMTASTAADEAAEGVFVRYCTVENADIAFYALARTDLRNILS